MRAQLSASQGQPSAVELIRGREREPRETLELLSALRVLRVWMTRVRVRPQVWSMVRVDQQARSARWPV